MNNQTSPPLIGITMGDPVGIGPEILAKTLCSPEIYSLCRPLVLGDPAIIAQILRLLNIDLKIHLVEHPNEGLYTPGTIDLLELSCIEVQSAEPGVPTAETGRAMEKFILHGIDLALDNQIDGLVTCPITKTALKLAGSNFHGHTELLASRTNAEEYAMMLAGAKLKVVLVTIHIPLSEVPASLSCDNIIKTIKITHDALKNRFGIKNPCLAVAGLNPHAGEDSMFGNEEADIIIPAVHSAQKLGFNVRGPLPPDTVFYKAANNNFDAVICMYHDQGLIPFKLIHFEDGVNTTLGLPIIRTSVDHGTAYDIAWKGIADPLSLTQAIKMAALQAENKKRNK